MKPLKSVMTIIFALCLICSFGFGAPGASAKESAVPEDAAEFLGNRYKVFYNMKLSWQESKEYCEGIGGHLAVITTKAEQDFVASIIPTQNTAAYFIGGCRISDKGWEWINGENWGYVNWRSDQPDNVNHSQAFLRIVYSPRYNWVFEWDDIGPNGDGEDAVGFICEWDCDNPIKLNELDGHYYSAVNLSLKWNEAKEYCESLGGHLATVTSDKEEEVIELLATDRDRYWLGASDFDSEGSWSWITDEVWSYADWKEGFAESVDADYLYYSNFEKAWNDSANQIAPWNKLDSIGTTGFVCEWDSAEAVKSLNMLGDTTSDGRITIKDATAIQKHVAQLEILGSKPLKVADTDNDGVVTVKDATNIQKYIADIIQRF